MTPCPLKRSPLVRKASLRRTGKLRQMSVKRRRALPARAACRCIVLARAKFRCEFPGCNQPGVHVHEKRLRSQGGDPTKPDGCVALCVDHHDWLHLNRDEARRMGLIIDGKAVPLG